MTKILHVTLDKTYEPLKGGGGVARFIHGLCQELSDLGAEPTVAAEQTDATGSRYSVINAVGITLFKEICRTDVVHLHGPRLPRMAFLAFLATLKGKPFIFTPHAYYDQIPPTQAMQWMLWKVKQFIKKRLYDKTVERFLYTHCFAALLENEHWMSFIRDEMRLPVDRASVLPNCIRQADIRPLPRHQGVPLRGKPSILSVSRLDEVKCLDHVIEALCLPKMAQAVFHIVGKGPDRSRLEKLAGDRKVQDRIVFYGVLDDAKVAAMTANCDVFVLPSRQEGMPTALIEMLLHGIPVVTSDIPGSMAILKIAGAKGAYPFGNIEMLAATILQQAGTTIPDKVRQRVIECLTWERRAPDYLALYERAATGKR
ncbi:MAG: glycosyl transferase family 1 [Rhodospirillaceae bacterium]|nr:MAG: glycosyl transferase family 1 [Rhodospirillaceae bacterium]